MAKLLVLGFVVLQQPTGGELDVWHVIGDATPFVKLILALLVLMSIGCWFIVGVKMLRLAGAAGSSRRFLDLFWGGEGPHWSTERLEGIYGQVKAYTASPLAAVFRAGYVELARVMGAEHSAAADADAAAENVERALRRSANTEMTSLENMLPFLATTGATAPFIGLLGTVWGIMETFIAMAGREKNLDLILPKIAEALIATAVGLLAAIPAVMAYNFFVRKIRVIESEVESFSNDYLNIVRRYFLRG